MIREILRKHMMSVFVTSFLLFVLSFFYAPVWAQSALTLGVSPTLINISLEPGESWSSSLRIINPNPYQLKVYVDVVNFYSQGEDGSGYFISPKAQDNTFANWVELYKNELMIPAGQVSKLPIKVNVPDNASPGGHFAAILVGTKPAVNKNETKVSTAQVTTSLLFLQVNGDVHEEGKIRSFSTAKKITDTAQMDFVLRFENTGNIHLLPRGEIKIVDWKNSVVGKIPINQNTDFGNVLPNTIRKYELSWKKDNPNSFWNIGYYRAIVSLVYGHNEKKFDHSKISFWVIPWKKIVISISILLFLIWLFIFSIKIYIRKVLKAAGISPRQVQGGILNKHNLKKISLVSPLKNDILDLRKRLKTKEAVAHKKNLSEDSNLRHADYKKIFFGLIVLCGVLALLFLFYVTKNNQSDKKEKKTPVSHAPTAMGEIFKIASGTDGKKIDDKKSATKNNANTSTTTKR